VARKPRRILDPIHSLIEFETEFDEVCWRIIETPQFQRLRRVKQLGFSEFVYPGATHSRFTHSIGVFHTARQLARIIRVIQGEKFDPHRAQTALAAALVHDLGHGPFSHAFEDVLRKLEMGKHEARSVKLIERSEVTKILDSYKPRFSSGVAEIINNKVPEDIYAAIVSSQFDADRLDYVRRDRFMTGTQSSAIDFDWLRANLEIHRVRFGQDEKALREIDTLVVGQKALLAAEAYVLGLFHLYQSVYFHKATRSAEKIFSALLARIFELALNSKVANTGLSEKHPLVQFAHTPDDLDAFSNLDDHVILGAIPLLCQAPDKCISELSHRLSRRKLYKAIDVTTRLQTAYSHIADEAERDQQQRKSEAEIRIRLRDSGLLESGDSVPLALEDVVSRDPYQKGQGDEAALSMIYAIDRTDELKELSSLSKVVAALKKYEVYRIYFREEDESTKRTVDKIIEEYSHA
jgi:uncharacterized protein